MLISNASLSLNIPPLLPAVYCLQGQDSFQLECFADTLTRHWKALHPTTDRLSFDLDKKADWNLLREEAAHYPLFGQPRLFKANFSKKTIDKGDKETLLHYLNSPPKDALLVITAAELSLKSVEDFWSMKQIHLIAAKDLSIPTIKTWIRQRLATADMTIPERDVELIFQYGEGNLRAIAQTLDKLTLMQDKTDPHQPLDLASFLHDQSLYILFHLPKFCFENLPVKAIKLLRQLKQQKQDPTLVLWVLTQAIRLLIKLQVLEQQKKPLLQAANQLKIWSHQLPIYQSGLKRYHTPFLSDCLRQASKLDKQLKMGYQNIYQQIEALALQLCKGEM